MNDTTDAASIFAPLWRRKWLILAVAVVVGLGSYAYYKRQRPTYQATTQVYLGAASEEAAPSEKSGGSNKASQANIANQAAVINSIVVEEVRKQLRRQHKGSLAKHTKVRAKATEKGEFITVTVEGHSAKGTVLLANLVARAYIRRQHDQRLRAIDRTLAIDRRQLRRIEAANAAKESAAKASAAAGAKGKGGAAGPSTSSIIQEANLHSKINQLESSRTVTGVVQIKVAKRAELVAPNPRKNAIFGFVLGLVLASIGVYVLSRLDRRLRSLRAIEEAFHAPVLSALPKVRRPIVHREGLPAPSRVSLEPLQRLQTALRLSGAFGPEADTALKVILVISPESGDGKSSVVAGLALVKRDAGERVAIVEANFRRPVQTGLLGLNVGAGAGLADVLAGTLSAEEAMQRVLPFDHAIQADADDEAGVATAVQARAGSLSLLAGGGPVPNPSAVLGQPAMRELLGALAADFDTVLIDAPSPLAVSDAMPLMKEVDGIVMVGRIGHTREASAQRLVELVRQASSAPLLGVVANCVAPNDMSRYGFSPPQAKLWPGRPRGR